MKSLLMGGFLAAAVLASAPAFAAVSPQDQTFVTAAAQGGKAEVVAAHMALTKSQNSAVRAFAQRMIADHTKANMQLATIAKSSGAPLPGTVDQMDQTMADQLSGLSGTAFDSAYLKGQQIAHKRTIALFTREAGLGKNPQLVAFAKQTLPVVKMHYSMVNTDVMKMAHS